MNSDIRKFLTLRSSLIQEKAKLENRLREINEALGEEAQTSAPQGAGRGRQSTAATSAGSRGGRGRGRRSASGGLSLKEAVLQVTAKGPLTKEEILEAVKQLGYRFSTNNPLNSLGVILYGKNPKFKNENGRFSPAGGAAASTRSTNGANAGGRKSRKLSPEARERIAAAQRARWAKSKSEK
jgi:hypothetical protein